MYNKMNSLFEDMSKYYCFDKKKYNMEDFFGDIKIFQDSFKVHCSFILWHVISMFFCGKYIYNVRATIAFPYKCYCTSIFWCSNNYVYDNIYIYFQNLWPFSRYSGLYVKIHNNLLKSKEYVLCWKSYFSDILQPSAKGYIFSTNLVIPSILSPEDTCTCLPMIFNLYCSKPSRIMLNKERPMLDYNVLKKPKSVLKKRRKREWQLAKVSSESLSLSYTARYKYIHFHHSQYW